MNYSEPTFINCPVTARGQRFRDHKTFSDRLHPPHSRWSGVCCLLASFLDSCFLCHGYTEAGVNILPKNQRNNMSKI